MPRSHMQQKYTCPGGLEISYDAGLHTRDNLRQMPSTQFPFYNFWSKEDASALYHFLFFLSLTYFFRYVVFRYVLIPFFRFFIMSFVIYVFRSFFMFCFYICIFLAFVFFFFLWLRPCGGPGRCAESPWRSAAPVRSAMCFAGSRSSGVLIW